MNIQDGPFLTALQASKENVIKQELITYYVNDDGNTAKKTADVVMQKRTIPIILQLRFLT